MPPRDFRIHGHGSDLAIEARGPDLAQCLDAATAGFAAALAEIPDTAPRQRQAIAVEADDPSDLLIGLFEELIVIVDADGLLPIALADLRELPGGWEAVLAAVPLDALEIHGVAPKAATWHQASLTETAEGWQGWVTLDL